METYQKAYKSYLTICENFGMESIPFHTFVQNLTKEQIDEYSKLPN